MKKQSMVAMAMVIGLTGSSVLPTQAVSRNCSPDTILQTENCVMISGKVNNVPEVKSVLEEFCNGLQNGNQSERIIGYSCFYIKMLGSKGILTLV